MYDIIIIGAGPAGLTSALYVLRGGKKVLILESKSYGGQIINASWVENYPGITGISGFDLAQNMFHQVQALGGLIKYEEVLKITENKEVVTKKATYQAQAIIIATGLENRSLNLPHENKFLGHGLSYCATCDGNFFKDQVVAVVGGGNSALEDCLYLSDIAKKVYLIHRRENFRGEDYYLEKLKKKDNVKIILKAQIIELKGEEKLEQIVIQKDDTQEELKVKALFVAIGKIPHNQIFANVVDLDAQGFIMTKEEVKTKTKGIFAAGDARVKDVRQLTTAVSDGTIAAQMAIELLREN